MNTRIEELALQAGFSKDKYSLYWDEDANSDGVDLEKFAKLIVQECLGIIDDEREPTLVSRIELWEQFKEHFGVK